MAAISSQIFGHYVERSTSRCEYLKLVFSPLVVPLRTRWRNNGLSADFLGDYVITFLPTESALPGEDSRQRELRHAVTYIGNELLENAMKFHERSADIPIGIHLELTSEQICLSATNGVGVLQAQVYRTFIEALLRGDPHDLLIKRLEEGSNPNHSKDSGLGLLTMLNDYGAKLGWRFDGDPAVIDVMTVTTRAVLSL